MDILALEDKPILSRSNTIANPDQIVYQVLTDTDLCTYSLRVTVTPKNNRITVIQYNFFPRKENTKSSKLKNHNLSDQQYYYKITMKVIQSKYDSLYDQTYHEVNSKQTLTNFMNASTRI